jgi:hypothetical protein
VSVADGQEGARAEEGRVVVVARAQQHHVHTGEHAAVGEGLGTRRRGGGALGRGGEGVRGAFSA